VTPDDAREREEERERTTGSGLTIVVVNYGSHELLDRNLVPVASALPGAQIVVLDNHSTIPEAAIVESMCRQHGWRSVLCRENLGFGAGVNRAVSALDSETDFLLLLNPDATLERDSILRLLDHVRTHPLDLVAPIVRRPDGRIWSAGHDLDLTTARSRSWTRRDQEGPLRHSQPWLSGACLMLSRELWDRTGGFDEDYFLYWEDVDLSRRALDAGARLLVDDQAVATHDVGGTQPTDQARRTKSAVYYYYNTRNRLVFAAKHLDADDQRRWRRSAWAAAYEVLMRGGRRQLRHPRRTVVPVWRGTRDGLRAMREHDSRRGAKD
jgi:N-acetylglucosaminyl-diphospho-decaprenol L-rhamnosyltransferase